MSQQHLNDAQVGSGFQQVRGKAMTQSVRMDVPMLKTNSFGGVPAGPPDNLGVELDGSRCGRIHRETTMWTACALVRAS
jgi:hypothetical protein